MGPSSQRSGADVARSPLGRAAALAPALALALSLASGPALADEPLADDEAKARLSFIKAKMDENEGPAKLWFWGWTAGFVGLTAAQGGVALVTGDRDLRIDAEIGAICSALGLVSTLALPPEAAFGASSVRVLPDGTPDERRASLVEAERRLRKAAFEARLGKSWLPHVAGFVVNLAASGVRWFRYDHHTTAVVGMVGGLLVGEAKIFTQPDNSIAALDEYERRFGKGGASAAAQARPAVTLSVAASASGVWLTGVF